MGIAIHAQIKPLSDFDFAYVAGGQFMMGDSTGDGYEWERPYHTTIVSSFYISKTEITQAVYQEVMSYNPSKFIGPNRPVDSVSWYEALEFCNNLSKLHGRIPVYIIEYDAQRPNSPPSSITINPEADGYRLPSEAEWEFAARGGLRSYHYKYPGSDTTDDVAWSSQTIRDESASVAQKRPNELGIFDMAGNVAEWCFDYFSYYSARPQKNPMVSNLANAGKPERILRGGSWFSKLDDIRPSSRLSAPPAAKYSFVGFRVVRTAK